MPGLDRARVRVARLGGRPLHARRCDDGHPPRFLARDGHGLQPRRAGGGEPARAQARRTFAHHTGPCRRGADWSGRDVADAAVRRHHQGRPHVRPRRERHEVRRRRDGVRTRRPARGWVSARLRPLRADRDRGRVHRQRRALHARARLPRRRLPDPRADRPDDPARHRRRDVVPPAHSGKTGACFGERARHQRDPLGVRPGRGAARSYARIERAREKPSVVQPHPQSDQIQPGQDRGRRLGELDACVVRGRLPHRGSARHAARGVPRGADAAS